MRYCFSLLVVILFLGSPGVAYGQFDSGTSLSSTADGAVATHLADMDGDGDLDILAVSFRDDRVAWFENMDGLGDYSGPVDISQSVDRPTSVSAADLDEDGDLDVLVAAYDGGMVVWYENLGNAAAFSTENIIAQGLERTWHAISADVDGDGDLDVVSATQSGQNVRIAGRLAWYANDGIGNFGPLQLISADFFDLRKVEAGDLDGDGDLDLATVAQQDDQVAWFENLDGAGTYGPKQVVTTSANTAYGLDIADIDQDGDLDLVSASAVDRKIAWYENLDGLGAFGAPQVISLDAFHALDVVAADADADGDLDVFSASYNDGKFAWYENLDGLGSFGPQIIISSSNPGAFGLAVGDVDGDGDNDLAGASEVDDSITLFTNQTLEPIPDTDLDSIPDDTDNCVLIPNPDQSDLDQDGQGDACDEDRDGDGVANTEDEFPDDPAEWADNDEDGIGDNGDPDDDNDGQTDLDELACGSDPLDARSLSLDTDGDNLPDCTDPDDDGDGVDDTLDNCPLVGNPDQADLDGDGIGDVCDPDDDNDGVLDVADNCPTVANADQADFDGDGIGDACDPDIDADGVDNSADMCALTTIPESVPTVRLNPNRWALTDGDLNFDTVRKGKGSGSRSYSTTDTAGCSCSQIIEAQGLGNGHTKFGCSNSAMDDWVALVAAGKRVLPGVEPAQEAPGQFELRGNYPNPFNPTTQVRIALPEAGWVHVAVFDVMGRQVELLVDGNLDAGVHDVAFNAAGLPSGTYFYRVRTATATLSSTMLLLK